MIVVLSGEGPSDLGTCNNGQGVCQTPAFVHGPMTLLVDQEIETRLAYSIMESNAESYIYVREERLSELDRQRKLEKRNVSFVGKKQAVEMGYFAINAWMLGEETLRLEEKNTDQAIAVFFRDCDGTRSDRKDLWQEKHDSMIQGFTRSGLGVRGVPMIPKPKSEAWMLCAVANNYRHCTSLEALPGNDASPNSAKSKLNEALDGKSSSSEQVDWIKTHGFEHDLVANQMPSYQAFKNDLAAAIAAL